MNDVISSMYIFVALSTFLYIILFMLWIRRILVLKKITKSIPADDICCTLNMVVMFLFYIVDWVILIQQDVGYNSGRSPMLFTYYMYMLFAYTVVISAINTRYIRSSIVQSLAQHEAETKRMLVGYFSHEIRTPLNSVLMGLQVVERDLRHDMNKEENLSLIDELHSQCDMAVDILNDLMLYERLEEGIIDLNLKPLAIKQFIIKKMKALRPLCREKGIEMEVVWPSETDDRALSHSVALDKAYCRGDEDKLGQVIRTLLTNAVECTPRDKTVKVTVEVVSSLDGTPLTDVSPRRKSWAETVQRRMTIGSSKQGTVLPKEPEYTIRIQIKDEGAGVTPEEQETLFQNALSFTAGVLQVRQGKGLGLWISHSIMMLHKGDLRVSCDGPNLGCLFTIEIPVFFRNASSRVKLRQRSESKSVSKWLVLQRKFSSFSSSGSIETIGPVTAFDADTDLIEMVSDRFIRHTASIYPTISPKKAQPNHMLGTIRSVKSEEKSSRCHHYESKDDESPSKQPDKTPNPISQLELCPDEIDCKSDECPTLKGLPASISSSEVIPKRVLVVDDAPMNRRMLCRLLVGHCDGTIEAEDGGVAIEKMTQSIEEKNPFALVLMDYQMPNMDGPTAAKAIRELGYDGPIIGVTGNSLASHIDTFIQNGANRVCSKPLHFSTLLETLEEMGKSNILTKEKHK
eukprot:CAMPEP_0182422362 /NCGR_PEP_ID=MMETSP1167-20130531/8023_1 /TAXON_ID=2988 /ORGANISM="Mallomonas Sp, Strain CCMP3275" /LENGTH=685 /DNA_ID=CAMNT_0024600361 /DNA_START=527 /DNA_END=2584 /DNA_ORIENTATION=-